VLAVAAADILAATVLELVVDKLADDSAIATLFCTATAAVAAVFADVSANAAYSAAVVMLYPYTMYES